MLGLLGLLEAGLGLTRLPKPGKTQAPTYACLVPTGEDRNYHEGFILGPPQSPWTWIFCPCPYPWENQ